MSGAQLQAPPGTGHVTSLNPFAPLVPSAIFQRAWGGLWVPAFAPTPGTKDTQDSGLLC